MFIPDSELNYLSLSNRVSDLLDGDLILQEMAEKTKDVRYLNAGDDVAQLIFEIIDGGSHGK